jgi:thioesterase domain-containing protein
MAYEMARQLRAQGQVVDQLVLMDPAVVSPSSALLRRLIRRAGRVLRLSKEQQIAWFVRLLHSYELVRLLPRRGREAWHLDEVEPGFADKVQGAWPRLRSLFPSVRTLGQSYRHLYNWVTLEYAMAPYAGKTVILWAEDERFRGVWQRKAATEPQVELHFTPGTHMTCRTDHLQELADLFREVVRGAPEARVG